MTSITRAKRLNRKLFASISCGLLICSFTLLLIIERHYTEKIDNVEKETLKKPHDCYQRNDIRHSNDYAIKYLEDVMDIESRKLIKGENIFFHETTCSRSGLVHLNCRQACAIESAAKMNPERDVFVLFASPVGFRDGVSHLPASIEALKAYPNIHLRNNNVWKYAEGTPLEEWLSNGSLFESKYLHEHMSDVLRFVTLYKFGGIYLDLDVIVQRNFDDLGTNFAGDDSVDAIGCGVLHFGSDKLGREVAEQCIQFLIRHFNGKLFIDNGPLVITRTLERLCETENRNLMTRQQCKGFHVYPRQSFYAVSWTDWKTFFHPSMANHTLEVTRNSTVIHVWNDVSKNTKVKIGAQSAYEVAAKINCPKVYRSRINYEYF